MPYTRIVCVPCGQKSLHPLDSSPYFPERKRNPANLFTFPKCQDILGGLRVSAQSTRQLFCKKNVQADFSFASPLTLAEDRAAHLPGRLGQAWFVGGGWDERPPGHSTGLATGCAPGWSGWAQGSQPEWNLVRWGSGRKGSPGFPSKNVR